MPKCPKCGEPVGKGGNSRGKQRWLHAARALRRACKWHGTDPVGLRKAAAKGVDRKKADSLHRAVTTDRRRIRRYVITAAQNATPVHKQFLASLLGYCKHNGARLLVVPYRYKNPTSMWSKAAEHDDWWAPELAPYLMDKRIELNDHLVILGDIKTQPTATAPLGGLETITWGRSAIAGHPRLELKTVATPQHKLPKILSTTGACTQLNYIDCKAGKKGEHHHTFGAAVVEVDGDVFHLRQLNAAKDGSFIDLSHEYRGGERFKITRIEALVMGDTHFEFADPAVMESTFGPGGVVDTLCPKVIVWHDVIDFYARNHHHRGEVFTNYAKHHAGIGNIREQLEKCFEYIDKITPPDTLNVFVPSNHPDALARWVKEADPKTDPENALFWAETFTEMCKGAHMTDGGASTIDPFAYWAKKLMRSPALFLRRDQSYVVKGIELTYHGDRGANGSKGTLKSFTKLGVKSVTGHGHSPGIEGGGYRTGTNSRLRLEYNGGPSSWLHTDCLIYKNGKRSLLNFIEGKWRA